MSDTRASACYIDVSSHVIMVTVIGNNQVSGILPHG